MKQFMFDFTIPYVLDDEFMGLIPAQQMQIAKLFHKGDLVTYTLAQDRQKLWATVKADTEEAAINIIESLPLTSRMDYIIHELMFNELGNLITFPAISLN